MLLYLDKSFAPYTGPRSDWRKGWSLRTLPLPFCFHRVHAPEGLSEPWLFVHPSTSHSCRPAIMSASCSLALAGASRRVQDLERKGRESYGRITLKKGIFS